MQSPEISNCKEQCDLGYTINGGNYDAGTDAEKAKQQGIQYAAWGSPANKNVDKKLTYLKC